MSSPAQESDPCDSPRQESADRTGLHNNETDDNNSDSSDSDNNDTPDGKSRPPPFLFKMLNLGKEITVMILIAVVYATLTNETPPKVSKSPAAYPFFSKNSLVTDWYKGQITEAIEDARSSDIAFVMFYAPWDAESQTARKQFEVAAEIMHEQVTFAGINCWQPGSECRRQYSKVYKWPVLIAYPTHGRGIQYNGPLEALHMVRFLQNVCKPVLRCRKLEELWGKYDTIVAGNVNLTPGSYGYAVFYSTAMRVLERDPFRDVAFAVLPHKGNSSIQINVWNGTIEYEGEWNSESLTAWVVKNMQQIVTWLSPTGMKSLTMSNFIQPGPTLVLFTPKNPLYEMADLYNMFREVAFDYHNCNTTTTFTTRQKLIQVVRLRSRKKYDLLRQTCLPEKPKDVVTSLPNVWTNNTLRDMCNCVSAVCPGDSNHHDVKEDQMSAKYLQTSGNERECQQFLLAQKYFPTLFESVYEMNTNITGLACRTNLTLTFVALDSLRYHHFAEKLGLGLGDHAHRSGLVIVDERMETHHVLEEAVNSENVRSFIRNFTLRTLTRSLGSRARLKFKHRHSYPVLSCSKQDQIFCVAELTSSTFLKTILQPDRVVIVFYYSKQCSFCSGISHVFLTVAKMLSNVKEVAFARIDGDTNLLPWQYTMETYPTILFIPATRKSESRIFPKNIRVTVPNLVGFILTNMEPILKLKTMWHLCLQAKFPDEEMKCITSVRIDTLGIINKTLKEWRSSGQRAKILRKLQVLKHLHLLLAHSPDKISDVQSCLRRLI